MLLAILVFVENLVLISDDKEDLRMIECLYSCSEEMVESECGKE